MSTINKVFITLYSVIILLLLSLTTPFGYASQLDENGDHRNIESLKKDLFWDSPNNMILLDSLLFVSSGQTGICAIDVSDPDHPDRISHFDPENTNSSTLGIYDNCLFYTQQETNGNLIRLLNSFGYEEVERIPTFSKYYQSGIKKISAHDDIAYVLSGDSLDFIGLVVTIFGDSLNEWGFEDSVLTTLGTENGIEAFETYEYNIFIADGLDGLRIFDHSIPSNPVEIGNLTFQDEAKRIAVSATHAFIGMDTSTLKIVNVSDTQNPTLITTIDLDDIPEIITVENNKLYVTDISNKLYIFDITNPAIPEIEGSYQNPHSIMSMVPFGDTVFLLDSAEGVVSVDISSPSVPSINWTYGFTGKISDAVIDGNSLFISDFHSGLKIYDISDPDNMTLTGLYGSEGEFYDLCLAGNNIFLLNHQTGLNIIDVSDSSNPLLIWSENDISFCEKLIVHENFVYVLCNYYGEYSRIHIWNITDISDPTMVANYRIGDTTCKDIDIKEEYIYLLTDDILILDISNLDNIFEVRRIEDIDFTDISNIDISGDFAYVSYYFGLIIYYLNDPTNPEFIRYHTTGRAKYVKINDHFAFTAKSHHGLGIYNISCPISPTLMGYYDSYFYAYDLDMDDDKVFLHNNYYFEIYEYSYINSDFTAPTAFDLISPENNATVYSDSIEFSWSSNQYTYVLWYANDSLFTENTKFKIIGHGSNLNLNNLDDDQDYWWKVVAYSDSSEGVTSNQTWRFHVALSNDISDEKNILPEEFQLVNVYPNPFNPSLNIEVALPETADLILRFYNVLGKEVGVINRSQLDAGYHSFVFDGSDLSSGVYFMRASVPGKLETTKKVVLMK